MVFWTFFFSKKKKKSKGPNSPFPSTSWNTKMRGRRCRRRRTPPASSPRDPRSDPRDAANPAQICCREFRLTLGRWTTLRRRKGFFFVYVDPKPEWVESFGQIWIFGFLEATIHFLSKGFTALITKQAINLGSGAWCVSLCISVSRQEQKIQNRRRHSIPNIEEDAQNAGLLSSIPTPMGRVNTLNSCGTPVTQTSSTSTCSTAATAGFFFFFFFFFSHSLIRCTENSFVPKIFIFISHHTRYEKVVSDERTCHQQQQQHQQKSRGGAREAREAWKFCRRKWTWQSDEIETWNKSVRFRRRNCQNHEIKSNHPRNQSHDLASLWGNHLHRPPHGLPRIRPVHEFSPARVERVDVSGGPGGVFVSERHASHGIFSGRGGKNAIHVCVLAFSGKKGHTKIFRRNFKGSDRLGSLRWCPNGWRIRFIAKWSQISFFCRNLRRRGWFWGLILILNCQVNWSDWLIWLMHSNFFFFVNSRGKILWIPCQVFVYFEVCFIPIGLIDKIFYKMQSSGIWSKKKKLNADHLATNSNSKADASVLRLFFFLSSSHSKTFFGIIAVYW